MKKEAFLIRRGRKLIIRGRIFAVIVIWLLSMSIFALAFYVQPAKAKIIIAPNDYPKIRGVINADAYSWSFKTEQVLSVFGKIDVGSSRSNLCQYSYGSRYQIPDYGAVQSIFLYVEEINGLDTVLEVAIYNDSSGIPTSLLAQGSTTVTASYSGWVEVSLSEHPTLIKGNYYWLVANARASGKALRFAYSAGEPNQAIYGTTSLASFPTDPCKYSGFRNRAYSIYCTYTVATPTTESFGKVDVGESYSNLCQFSYGSRYQISKNGVAQSVSIMVWETNGEDRAIKVAIYSDNGGKPEALLASGSGTVPAGFRGWVTINLTNHPTLSAGNYYWLVANALAAGKLMRVFYSTGYTNQSIYACNFTATFESFPYDPCKYAGFRDRAYSIYCNYFIP